MARQRQKIGMVFQDFNLFPHRTALENVTEGPVRVKREDRQAAVAHARQLLEHVGVAHRANAYPAQLSGGEAQRVAIARALAMRPEVLLMDEPTSALDPERVAEVLEVMRTLASEDMTLVVVTHEVGFALDVSDTVVLMRDGRVVDQGPPAEVIRRPASKDAKDFFASIASIGAEKE